MSPISEIHLRSARRWSRRLSILELKLANRFMLSRGVDWCKCWSRVPPLKWVEKELRYWMPALAKGCVPVNTSWAIEVRFGIILLAV